MNENLDYGIFEPEINDFGDEYHRPDEEVFSEVSTAVKSVRRKYRRYNEYVEAVRIISQYFDDLKEKYGGKKNFKIALQLGMVKEFIPPIPKFRKTPANLVQAQAKCIISEQDETKMDFSFGEEFEESVENASSSCGDGFELEENPVGYFPFDLKRTGIKEDNDEQTIAQELELLQKYSESEEYKAAQSGKKKKKSSRNLLKEAKRRKKALEKLNKPKTIGEIIDYYNGVCNGTITEEDENFKVYRGIIVPSDDLDTMILMKDLQAAGFVRSNAKIDVDSKELRKMIREDEKSKKKKKKKRDDEISQEDMDEFLDDYNGSDRFGSDYANFKAFEKEMLAFDSGAMFRGVDS